MIHIVQEGESYWNSPMWKSLAFCVVSLAALLIFRSIYSVPIEIDGDSVGKWFSATSIARDGEWTAMAGDHHQLRWSIMFPQILVAKILPWRYENYYVLPMLFYSLFTLICMLIPFAKPGIKEWPWILLLAVAISIDPISHVMASQLKTVAFGLFYFVFGVFVFLYYLKYRRIWMLALSAVLFFFAYGAHVTYILFSLAPLLVLTLHLREYRTAAIFLAMLLLLFAAEALLTGVFLEGLESGGRLQLIVSGTSHEPIVHAIGKEAPEIMFRARALDYGDLFARWKKVPKYNFLVLTGYLFGAGLLLIRRIRQSVPISIWLFFYAAGIYGLAVTFPVLDTQPLRLAMGLRSRYLAPFFPLALVFVVWIIYHGSKVRKGFRNALTLGASAILSIVFFTGSYSYSCVDEVSSKKYSSKLEKLYCYSFRYSQNQNIYPAPDAFVFRAHRYYEDFDRDYVDGEISLYAGTRISILRLLIRFKENFAFFVETPKGWYSIDGQDNEWCVSELGQTEKPEQNYRYCLEKKVSKDVFN